MSKAEVTINLSWRQIAGVVAGNGLEFYDFLIYTFFAAQIGSSLFPTSGGYALLLSLGTFGIGFLTRPLGALVIGRMADRSGRKPAMLLAFALMGVATLGLVLTPPFSHVGILAPLSAMGFRLLQGFALGGQVGSNTAYLLEAAPPGKRGLYISFQYVTQEVAVLAAGVVGLVLSVLLSAHQLEVWGWRIAFAIGAIIIPFGLTVRKNLQETYVPNEFGATEAESNHRPVVAILSGLLLIGAGTITHYTLDYLTIYAQTVLHLGAIAAFGSTLMLGITGIFGNLASGLMVDRFGRKRVMLGPWMALIVLTVPAFMFMIHRHDLSSLLLVTAFLSILLSFAAAPALVLVTEALPQHIRAGSIGLVYALAISIFGGSAQFIETLLMRVTDGSLAPAWYMSAAMIVGLLGIIILKEQEPETARGYRAQKERTSHDTFNGSSAKQSR